MAVPRFRIEPKRSRVWIEARSSLHPIASTTDGLEGHIDLEIRDGVIDVGASPAGNSAGRPNVSLRFFTAAGELPACGHGTVAALAVLARRARAREYEVATIAFPALGTGVGGYPLDEAAQITLAAVRAELPLSPSIEVVTFARAIRAPRLG